jgi:hypothetical protein
MSMDAGYTGELLKADEAKSAIAGT